MESQKSFSADLEFLNENSSPVVLTAPDGGGRVVVSPGMQGRVMTSTADGKSSYGWINYSLIESGRRREHINAFGGEDRFWLGPEGGQYSIFFKAGEPMDINHWQTPEPIDWGSWDVVSTNKERIEMVKGFVLDNAAGCKFSLRTRRVIKVFSRADIAKTLGVEISDGVNYVGFESLNAITNAGNRFEKEYGLLSIWTLGMFKASSKAVVVVPFKADAAAGAHDLINAGYFGRVSDDRLNVDVRKGVAFFRGDGKSRGKIGVSPKYAKEILGSWTPELNTLTIVMYSLPANAEKLDYVNSTWEIQKEPYSGDAVNSYNDGPAEAGGLQLGQFYELETSSPAMVLGPSDKQMHTHRTFHFTGKKKHLNEMAQQLLGMSMDEIEKAL
ncbi:MAG TPA: hypothetical protein PKK48_05180 [Phycisphaerae bacterium]|nr:hypothetical protein [Phycisphaerae bacterium]HPS52602.1 hypothetical protein [Phycisphaerae bacterium]